MVIEISFRRTTLNVGIIFEFVRLPYFAIMMNFATSFGPTKYISPLTNTPNFRNRLKYVYGFSKLRLEYAYTYAQFLKPNFFFNLATSLVSLFKHRLNIKC